MKSTHYLSIIIALASLPIIIPVGLYFWSFWWHVNGDTIKEQLGLLPPDTVCLIEDWQPTEPDDLVDPRQFCNTNLKRNKGTPVDKLYNHK